MKDPEIFNATSVVSRHTAMPKEYVLNDLARKLAQHIADVKVQATALPFGATEYRMSVIVCSPDEFFRMVEEAAMRGGGRHMVLSVDMKV